MSKKLIRVTFDETRESMNILNDPKRSFSDPKAENLIFLVLDCYSYIGGEKVTGEVLLLISEVLPNSCLKFTSKGVETTSVYDKHDRSKLISEETRSIFKLDTTIESWEEGLSIGQYVFPFNFKLPSFCPSTFYYSGEDVNGFYVKAEIVYYISIKLEVNNTQGLSHMRVLNVKNKACLDKPGPFVEVTALIPGCCFSQKGSTDFRLSIGNTDHCQVNGQVMYQLIPNNLNCRAPINQVIGCVIMEIDLTAKNNNFKVLKKLAEVNRPTWISAFTSLIYERDFEYHADLKISSEELNPGSVRSSLIRCEYFIEMLVFYDIAFNKNPVVVRLPFHVNPKLSHRKDEPRLPFDWSPIESSIYNLLLESEPGYL